MQPTRECGYSSRVRTRLSLWLPVLAALPPAGDKVRGFLKP